MSTDGATPASRFFVCKSLRVETNRTRDLPRQVNQIKLRSDGSGRGSSLCERARITDAGQREPCAACEGRGPRLEDPNARSGRRVILACLTSIGHFHCRVSSSNNKTQLTKNVFTRFVLTNKGLSLLCRLSLCKSNQHYSYAFLLTMGFSSPPPPFIIAFAELQSQMKMHLDRMTS